MSDGYLRLNESTASESIGRWYRSRLVAWTSIGRCRAGLCSTSPSSYHRPACDPPSTWSTSPVTWPAFARYRTASVTSFTCAIFPIGCNVRRNSFGSFSCMDVSTIPGATALNLIPSLAYSILGCCFVFPDIAGNEDEVRRCRQRLIDSAGCSNDVVARIHKRLDCRRANPLRRSRNDGCSLR